MRELLNERFMKDRGEIRGNRLVCVLDKRVRAWRRCAMSLYLPRIQKVDHHGHVILLPNGSTR